MKTIIKLFAVAVGLAIGFFTSCNTIFEDLPPCQQGVVRVRVYVESFLGDLTLAQQAQRRAAAPTRSTYEATSEQCLFGERIETLHYYLYKDGVFYQRGEVRDIANIQSHYTTLQWENLPYGEYNLVMTANCAEKVMRGNFEDPTSLTVAYQENEEDAADFFVDSFTFSVTDDQCRDYDTQLKRVHGVVRYSFNNVHPSITAIEISTDGLTSSGCVNGTYSDDYTFVKRIPVNVPRMVSKADGNTDLLPNEPTIAGLFPTVQDGVSSWSIRLFKDDGDVEFYGKTISDDIRVARNDLLDLSVTFEEGMIMFYINTDLVWEGALTVDGTIVN